MPIKRTIFDQIKKALSAEPKIIIIYGPRQSGKTTLLNQLREEIKMPSVFFNADDLQVQEVLGQQNLASLKNAVGQPKLIFIDEGQRINNIGLTLKLLFDNLHCHILVTGSSSFELANKISEPLTGRTLTFFLSPLAFNEVPLALPQISYRTKLEEFLRFGLYPKVITLASEEEKITYLQEVLNNYLYKDILSFAQVRKPKKVVDLLSLLALQIGSEVATSELAQNLALARIIVEKYLDLLEKMFLIFNLGGFSRNLRKEISKTSKYYFRDLGLRNALIRNFNPLKLRTDVGVLWENFCLLERQKILNNQRRFANFYFWRTYDQKEIDLIEEKEGKLTGFEFKWSPLKKTSQTRLQEFLKTYKNSQILTITPANFETQLTR